MRRIVEGFHVNDENVKKSFQEALLNVSYHETRQPIAVSDISVYICLIDIRDGSSKPVYGGVDRLMIGTYSYAYLWYTM